MIARSSPLVRSEAVALLAQLRALDVDPPADAVAAVALAEEVERLAQPPDVARWVARADLSTLSGFNVLDTLHTAVVQLQLTGPAGRGLLREAVDALAARAAAALAADTDRLIEALRPRWDAAAAVVAAAAATGIQSASTAADAIRLGAAAADAWRTLPPSVAALDQLYRLRNTLMCLAGREVADEDLGAPRWLDRSAVGPVQLTSATTLAVRHREEIPA